MEVLIRFWEKRFSAREGLLGESVMATKSCLALPPIAAVFGWLFLLLPTGLFAQVTPGSLADCIGLVDIEFSAYMAVEESYVDSGCVRRQVDAYIAREGLNGTDVVKFYAFADMRQCWVQDETGVVGTIFGLSGGDVAAWKKYLLNEGCDLVTYVAPDERIVFVTSQTFTGNLIQEAKNLGIKGKINSGLDAADKICTKLANDAGLPGDGYTAWLSDATMNASDRVVHSEVPYVLVTDTQIAGDF
jgi:hypothetical protein